jgi:hypothetical protein
MVDRKRYTREDYAPFIGKSGQPNKGLLPLPNAKSVDAGLFLNDLAARGHMMEPVWGYSLLPDGDRQQWTQFFLLGDANMGMQLGGGGYAVTYGSTRWDAEKSVNVHEPIVRHFQICVHEIELHAGANPSRGWNPGHCKHCGMDMTVDSGD